MYIEIAEEKIIDFNNYYTQIAIEVNTDDIEKPNEGAISIITIKSLREIYAYQSGSEL